MALTIMAKLRLLTSFAKHAPHPTTPCEPSGRLWMKRCKPCPGSSTSCARRPIILRTTVGADKNYDTVAFVAVLRSLNATPHVTRNNSNRRSAINGRVTRHPGYAISQVSRKRIEEGFGWIKAVGPMARTKLHGTARVGWRFQLTTTAYNLIRMPKLLNPNPLQRVNSQMPLLRISNACGLNPRFSAAC